MGKSASKFREFSNSYVSLDDIENMSMVDYYKVINQKLQVIVDKLTTISKLQEDLQQKISLHNIDTENYDDVAIL